MIPEPPPIPDRLVVVGAGLAGARTLAELRTGGYAGHVTLLGAEGVPPYDRPSLSKELLSRPEPAWLLDELGVDVAALADEVYLGSPAQRLAVHDRGLTLTLDDGHDVAADGVILACGAHAVRPWASPLTLHTAADAERLRARITPGVPLVIIGAGWIGAEVAGVAAAAGADVTVVEAAAAPLARGIGAELGARTVPWYAAAGVELLTSAQVAEVGAGGVRLADGRTLAADVVLSAVGVRPNTGWLAGTLGLTDSGHIPVDAAGRAQVPGVWAVGDCAARESARFGLVPGGHWSAALMDPAALAAGLLGLEPPAAAAPYVYSTQLGHQVSVFGRIDRGDLITRGDPANGPWTTLALVDGVLTGAVIADNPRDVSTVRKLLGAPTLPRLNPALAQDESVTLRSAVEH